MLASSPFAATRHGCVGPGFRVAVLAGLVFAASPGPAPSVPVAGAPGGRPSTPARSAGQAGEGTHLRFELTDGVFALLPREGGSTATVILGDGEAVVVDPHSTVSQAAGLAAEIRALGDVDVRWIVNSHWHQDHHGGTGTLLEHWPEARVVRHAGAHRAIATYGQAERSLLAASRERELSEVEFVQPDVEVVRPLVLWAAGRRIEVRPTAPAHTVGDLYVWLPGDGILVAGDLLTSPYVVPRSGFPGSYARVLRQLDRVPFRILVPGHGAPVDDGHARLGLMAEFLETVADVALVEAARSPDDLESVGARTAADPRVAAFEPRIPWNEEHAMRFLDFQELVHMTAVRALDEARSHGSGSDITAGYVDVPGASIYYEEVGSGEPVVLVHGGFMDARMWDPQFVPLAWEGYRVVRYDLAGFGRTLVDDPELPRSDAADLAAVLDRLGVDAAHVVGLSLGGTVALDFAVEWPERVRTLVLAETRPSGLPLPEDRSAEMARILEAGRSAGRRAGIRALLDDELFATARDDPEAFSKIQELVRDNFTTRLPPRAAGSPPAVDRLSRIDSPTLLVQGDAGDSDGERVARILQAGIPRRETASIPGAGHILNLERPGRFNEILIEFLARHRDR